MPRLFHRITLAAGILVAVVAMAVLFGGRANQLPLAAESAQFCPIAFKSEGSTTWGPIVRDSEAPFESAWGPGTDAQLALIGSGNGITKLIAGEVEAAPSSRPFTAGEADGKYVYAAAKDEFVIEVKDSPAMAFLTSISIPQVQQIYTAGAGINGLYWDQLVPAIPGAPHALIIPRARITGSGSQPDFLAKFSISAAAEAATIDATGLPRLTESADMAAEAAANDNQIIYTSLGNLPPSLGGPRTGVLAIPLSNGVSAPVGPGPSGVINPSYPAIRTLFIGVRNNAQNPRIDNSNVVRADDWVNFLRGWGPNGAPFNIGTIMSNAGFVPIAPAARPPVPNWDVNMDGGTSLGDLGSVSAKWGQTSNCIGWIRADVNDSGNISLADIGGVTNKWGQLGFQCAIFANPCPE